MCGFGGKPKVSAPVQQIAPPPAPPPPAELDDSSLDTPEKKRQQGRRALRIDRTAPASGGVDLGIPTA